MSLPVETFERIEALSLEAAGRTVEIDGVTYSTTSLQDVRKKAPEPETLKVHTLTALESFLAVNQDALDLSKLLLHVVSPTRVDLVGTLEGYFQQRFLFVTAECSDLWSSMVGTYLPQEEMVTALFSRFEDTAERNALLAIVGNVVDEAAADHKDDGVKQTIVVRSGIQVADEIEVKNPWHLAPFRTFREVQQPESPFHLRVRKGAKGPLLSLHETDGGAWKLDAVQAVEAWLVSKSLGVPVLA